jgi:hypothetical protein
MGFKCASYELDAIGFAAFLAVSVFRICVVPHTVHVA